MDDFFQWYNLHSASSADCQKLILHFAAWLSFENELESKIYLTITLIFVVLDYIRLKPDRRSKSPVVDMKQTMQQLLMKILNDFCSTNLKKNK